MALTDIGQTLKNASNQGHLERAVHALFPHENILTDERKETHIKNPHTGKYLELDVWIPNLKLCFEFQDAYHYVSAWYTQITVEHVQWRDRTKKNIVRETDESLILVPCWWNGRPESLAQSVMHERPDVLGGYNTPSLPIPFNPPSQFFQGGTVPGIGELMLASFPPSLGFIQTISSAHPWWLGEKYDGVRFCWNPDDVQLYSRKGVELVFSDAFADNMPADHFLDGEIWFGRGYFPESQKLLSPTEVIDWPFFRGVTFDDPSQASEQLAFEDRYALLLPLISDFHPFLIVAPRILCKNRLFPRRAVRSIIRDGGEGVIMRKVGSLYEHGRNNSLVKLKMAREDREGLVVRVGKKYCTIQLPEGARFKVETKETIPLQEGEIVSFSYQNYSRHAIPVDPKIYRIRSDVSWEDVVRNFSRENQSSLNELSQRAVGHSSKPFKHWTFKNLRAFFEKFARNRKLNPFLPETWYSISRKQVSDVKGGESVLTRFRGGFAKTLAYLFPDIGLDESKFDVLPPKFGYNMDNRKKLFLEFAQKKGFDPLVPENWYNIKADKLHEIRGIKTVLKMRKTRFSSILVSVFPDLNLDPAKFSILPKHYYKNFQNRKNAFDLLAKAKGFDPLLADNWYTVTAKDCESIKGISSLIRFYNGSYTAALLDLYPDIGLARHKLPVSNFWNDLRNQRKFFERVAQKKGFDPLVPSNWYKVTTVDLAEYKGGNVINRHYRGSISEALLTIFPEIGLESGKFTYKPRNFWKERNNHKEFFEEFARERGFDSLLASNWYSVSHQAYLFTKGGSVILREYRSFQAALIELYPDIGLIRGAFRHVPLIGHWNDVANQRKYFTNFAARKFDPLVPANWYQINTDSVKSRKIGKMILRCYKGSLADALCAIFPNIAMDKSKFAS
eukprot:Phypoly_transcript_00636.p1 GENE.Phypoly_transcript_00636~~Phypoly_transcript_00636.p1  ORF type:complete len:901 (-),score=99.66 Phypoly_transcript_00636:59-2761(-)